MFFIEPRKILPFLNGKTKKEQKTVVIVCSMLITFLQHSMKSKFTDTLINSCAKHNVRHNRYLCLQSG